ncbi:hypothetical protein ACFLRW_06040, partial [Acidobacteriota bacterium]
MNNLSFNKIKFFKAKEVQKKRIPNNKSQINKENGTHFWEQLFNNPFLFLFLFVLVITYLTSYVPSPTLPQINAEEIATFDIEAPEDITLEDLETTEKKRREAVDNVPPIYNLSKNKFIDIEETIRRLFQSGRELVENPLSEELIENFNISLMTKYDLLLDPNDLNALITSNFPPSLEENLISLIGKISAQGIILTRNLFIRGEE